jgi:hypothetical protein
MKDRINETHVFCKRLKKVLEIVLRRKGFSLPAGPLT